MPDSEAQQPKPSAKKLYERLRNKIQEFLILQRIPHFDAQLTRIAQTLEHTEDRITRAQNELRRTAKKVPPREKPRRKRRVSWEKLQYSIFRTVAIVFMIACSLYLLKTTFVPPRQTTYQLPQQVIATTTPNTYQGVFNLSTVQFPFDESGAKIPSGDIIGILTLFGLFVSLLAYIYKTLVYQHIRNDIRNDIQSELKDMQSEVKDMQSALKERLFSKIDTYSTAALSSGQLYIHVRDTIPERSQIFLHSVLHWCKRAYALTRNMQKTRISGRDILVAANNYLYFLSERHNHRTDEEKVRLDSVERVLVKKLQKNMREEMENYCEDMYDNITALDLYNWRDTLYWSMVVYAEENHEKAEAEKVYRDFRSRYNNAEETDEQNAWSK